jgi:hypothetical protein
MDYTQQAQEMIDRLHKVYTGGNTSLFDFCITQHIGGVHNTKLRQAIVKNLTGEERQTSKCSEFAVADLLKTKYNQLTLF